MERSSGSYALVQYSPVPDRLEFFNIGIVLIVPDDNYVGVKMAENSFRAERYFESVAKSHLKLLKLGIPERIKIEFARSGSLRGLEEFAGKRANDWRISAFRLVAVSDPVEMLHALFSELVGEEVASKREPRMAKKLREAFARDGVAAFLDESPAPVDLPEAGIKISAPFGYQNGAYNLVDGVRLSGSANQAMQEAGRKAIEGGLLWRHFQQKQEKMRLVVVGDFRGQSNEFYHAVGDRLEENHVRLYRLDHLGPLVEDIQENASLHP